MLRLPFACLFLPACLFAQAKVDFNRDVRPILADHCFACHGPDEKTRKAGVRLDVREGAAAVLKGNLDSELIKRIVTTEKSEKMPPEKSGKPLSPAQVATLKAWVAQGAEYQEHWAFIAPKRPAIPTAGEKWARTPIDRFVADRFAKEGLKPSAEADKATLIRRVTLDLTGLPPTPTEVREFLADNSPNAYEKVVERLTKSIRYGERMALDWLDAARYADTNGYHIDNGRDMTRWREWVIDAFHQNKPYDTFTVEQLAGDLLPSPTIMQKVASGFNRNHMINFEGGAIPEEYHTAYIVDRVNTTTTVWLGLTVACAQCHDHKYDPITQRDFYKLYAFFNNVPERGLDGNRGNSVPLIRVPSKAQETRIAELKAKLAQLEKDFAAPNPAVDAAQAEWEKSPTASATQWKAQTLTNLRSKNGATFSTDKNGDVVVGGQAPAAEVYSFTFRSDVANLSAIRIEALPDDRLKGKGPGRSENGNFVMTGLKVTLGEGRGAKPIKLHSISADFSQTGFDPKSLLGKGSGWAIFPEVGKPHHLTVQLDSPVAAGQDVGVQLQFNSQFGGHQIGRFRVLATASGTPHGDNAISAEVAAALKVEPAKRSPAQTQAIRNYYRQSVAAETRQIASRIGEIKKEIADEEKAIPDAMVMEEMQKPRDTFVLMRGAYDKKGERVQPGTPDALPKLKPAGASANRLDLAKWLVSAENPLTARVTVNRYWQMLFGTGLVKTSEDFGTQGDNPSHPELLDWLAVEFRESGWDVRKLLTTIVTSATYRQASAVSKDLYARDPENRLLARGPRFRLQAEMLRDQALAVSGLLNGEVGGKSVSPYQPAGLWEELMSRADGANWTAQTYSQSKGKDLYRRTMYTFWKRTCPPAQLAALDAPDRETCVVRRSRTNTPMQALILMNDPTYVEAARKLAERMMTEAKPGEQINLAFELATARAPRTVEVTVLKQVFDAQKARFTKDRPAAEKLLRVGESPANEKLDVVVLAAWTMVANAILNLDEVLTRN